MQKQGMGDQSDRRKDMRKLYAGFVQADVEQPFVYRLSEEPIKQTFPDGTIETVLFGKLNAAFSVRLKRVFQST